jgi:hypothetical protein
MVGPALKAKAMMKLFADRDLAVLFLLTLLGLVVGLGSAMWLHAS